MYSIGEIAKKMQMLPSSYLHCKCEPLDLAWHVSGIRHIVRFFAQK
jgi:hypothetical protein